MLNSTTNNNDSTEVEFDVSDDVLVKNEKGDLELLWPDANTKDLPKDGGVAQSAQVSQTQGQPSSVEPVVVVQSPQVSSVSNQVVLPTAQSPVVVAPSVIPQQSVPVSTPQAPKFNPQLFSDSSDQLVLENIAIAEEKKGFFGKLFGGKKKEVVTQFIPQKLEGIADFVDESMDDSDQDISIFDEEESSSDKKEEAKPIEIKRPEVIGEYSKLVYTDEDENLARFKTGKGKKVDSDEGAFVIGAEKKKVENGAFDLNKYNQILAEAQEKVAKGNNQFIDVEDEFSGKKEKGPSQVSAFFGKIFKGRSSGPKSFSKKTKQVVSTTTIGRPTITAGITPVATAPKEQKIETEKEKKKFSFSSLFRKGEKNAPAVQKPAQALVGRPSVVVGGPTLGFGSEDAKEIAKLASHPAVGAGLNISSLVSQAVSKINEKTGLSLSLSGKLSVIVTAYLRDVRSAVDTKNLLQLSIDDGGLALSADQAGVVMSILSIAHNSVHAQPSTGVISPQVARQAQVGVFSQAVQQAKPVSAPSKPVSESWWKKIFKPKPKSSLVVGQPKVEAQKVEVVQPVKPLKPVSESWWKRLFGGKKNKTPETKIEPIKSAVEPKKESVVAKPAIVQPVAKQEVKPVITQQPKVSPVKTAVQSSQTPIQTPEKTAGIKQLDKLIKETASMESVMPKVVRMPKDVSGEQKIKISDIKTMRPHLVGPVEELMEMELVDFRRLGSRPEDAVNKIREKVKLAEQESFTNKIACIEAWQKSQPNQMYLDIGKRSLLQRKSVSDIINQDRLEKKQVLTVQEFNLISQLNKEFLY